MNDLQKIITQSDSEIDDYLSEVSKEQFIEDVKALIKNQDGKEVIKNAISKLQKLI